MAQTNVCTVKLAPLQLIETFGIGTGDSMPAVVKLYHTWEQLFSILLNNSFIELPGSNLKNWESNDSFNFYKHTQGRKNKYEL